MMVLDRIHGELIDLFLDTDRRVLALSAAQMADSFGNSFLIVVLPLYIVTGPVDIDPLLGVSLPVIGVSLTEALLIGIILSLFGMLNSIGQPITGRLSDLTGRRKLFILLGLALLAGANAAYAFVDSYQLLIVIRAVQGLGAAFSIPAAVALINELGTTETRGGDFGVYNTFRLIGFGSGPVVAGIIVTGGPYSLTLGRWAFETSGFDASFYVAAFGSLLSFVFVSLLISDPERTYAAAAKDLSVRIFSVERGQLLDPIFAVGVVTLFMAVCLALFATLEPILNHRLGQGSTLFAIQFAAGVVANIVFQAPLGRASDRYGRRPFLLMGFLVLVPSTLAQGIVTNSMVMIAVRFLQGVAVALVFAPGLALAGDLTRRGDSGTQLSVLTVAFGLGTAVGPLASGYLVRFGFIWPFAFGAVLGALGLVIVYTQVRETVEDARSIRPSTEQI